MTTISHRLSPTEDGESSITHLTPIGRHACARTICSPVVDVYTQGHSPWNSAFRLLESKDGSLCFGAGKALDTTSLWTGPIGDIRI